MRRFLLVLALGLVAALAIAMGCSRDSPSPTDPQGTQAAAIHGKFLVLAVPDSLNGQATTGAFRDLMGKQITAMIRFDGIREIHRESDHDARGIDFETGPTRVAFQGDAGRLDAFAASFEGQRFRFQMHDEILLIDFIGNVRGETDAERYSLEIWAALPVQLDEAGYPILEDFSNEVGEISLYRYEGPDDEMTDKASGQATVSLSGTSP